MPFATPTHLERLARERTHAATLADQHACALLDPALDAQQRRIIIDAMGGYAHQRDVLDQQIAWLTRDTAWTWPTQPAWTN